MCKVQLIISDYRFIDRRQKENHDDANRRKRISACFAGTEPGLDIHHWKSYQKREYFFTFYHDLVF